MLEYIGRGFYDTTTETKTFNFTEVLLYFRVTETCTVQFI